MGLSFRCSPSIRHELKMTLRKMCPHCGCRNDVSRGDDRLTRVCWNCKKPIYKFKKVKNMTYSLEDRRKF